MTPNKRLVILSIFLLVGISFLTGYQGSTDVGDYSTPARYFAGNFQAKLRISDSALYGAIAAPFVKIFESLLIFKIFSIIFLFLLIYSVYYTTKSKYAFWMMLLSPITWYMGPWINPIQLSALLFFWSYYLMKKFNLRSRISFLFVSGVAGGLSWAFWDGIIIFIVPYTILFLYRKKLYHFIYFLFFIFLGLIPKLFLDQLIFGFALSGILRYIFGLLSFILFQGIYPSNSISESLSFEILTLISLILFIPSFIYKLFSKENFNKEAAAIIFITFGILVILKQSQIRYFLIIIPIIIYELAPRLTFIQFKKHLIFSTIIIFLVSVPYIIQIGYSTNAQEFSSLITNFKNLQIYENNEALIKEDLDLISENYPNQAFVVGNKPDDYVLLASIYWGKRIKEFVSIQDYNLYLENSSILFEKKFMPTPSIKDRRQIWLAGGINKNENDETDYKNINFGIGLGQPINLKGFKLVRRYNSLYLSEKYE